MKLYNTHHVVEGCGKCLQTSCSCQIKERCWLKNGKFSIFRVRVLPLKPDKEPVMCSFYKQKRCSNPNCSYAHGEEELYIWKGTLEIRDAVLSPRHPISQPQFPPVSCSFMMKDGTCKNGKNCKFPHSKKELNNWELSYEPLKKGTFHFQNLSVTIARGVCVITLLGMKTSLSSKFFLFSTEFDEDISKIKVNYILLWGVSTIHKIL